jgi:sugar transferase (PEP-CTERM system associated)
MMLRIFRHYISRIAFLLFIGDLLVLLASFSVAALSGAWVGAGPVVPKFLAVTVMTAFLLNLGDLYNICLPLGRREVVARLLICQAAAAMLIAAVSFAVPMLRLGRLAFLEIVAGTTLGLIAWRAVSLGAWSLESMKARVLVVGGARLSETIAALEPASARPFSIIGFIDDDPGAAEVLPGPYALLGKTKDLAALIDETHPDLVLVAQIDRRGQFPTKALLDCRLRGTQVEDWPTFYEKATGKILVKGIRPSWLIFADGFVTTPRTEIVKRLFDLVISLVALILAFPIMGIVAVAISLESPGPVLYRQPRLGRHGCVFILNKFRSMRQNAEQGIGPVWATDRDPRVTRVGGILRRTRLDELPQLLNVLVGHMSFIGPRPERPEFVEELQKQIPYYMERLAVKPGITGWAQVRYRYGSSVEDALEKLQYDLYYIKNLSPFLDLLILINTVQVVLFARGR